MKKYFILLFLLGFILLIPKSHAFPIIENVSIHSEILLGETVDILCSCYDNESYPIERIYLEINGPDIILPTIDLSLVGNNSYFTTIDSYLDRTGQYDYTIYAINNNSQNTSFSGSFNIYRLISYINSISPSPAYIGDKITVYFAVKKDDSFISSSVDFEVRLNDQEITLNQNPAYDMVKGWILKFDSPNTAGNYDLEITATYNGESTANSSTIEVREPIVFEVQKIDRTFVRSNENITVTIKVLERDSPISLKKEHLKVQVSSSDANILSISQSGSIFDVKVTLPSVSSGKYEMKITFNYGNFSATHETNLYYVLSIEGEIKNSDGTGIDTKLKFQSDDIEREFFTNSDGKYSSDLPPGTYNVQFTFPTSTVYLYDVVINSFDDPIKYLYLTDVDIPGIRAKGIFVYEIALPYSKVYLELEYEEKDVLDETKLNVYKCSNWNSGIKVCNSKWVEINSRIDPIRNLAEVNSTGLSAYVIGTQKKLNFDLSLNKEEYFLKDLVKVRGITQDDGKNTVDNVSVKAVVEGTDISLSVFSDSNGIFSFEFLAPEEEGDYSLFLKAEKYPFISFNKSITLKVCKSEELSLLAPDSIKINQGEELTSEFSVINTGQSELLNLSLSLEGVPKSYFDLQPSIDRLAPAEEKTILIYFKIPKDASMDTYTATLKASSDGISAEKIFALTILGEETDKSSSTGFKFPTISFPTANIVLPSVGTEVLYIASLSMVSFSLAYFAKKKKRVKNTERSEVKNLLLDIRREINRSMKRKK